ncbi:exodeoxyribonuclease VII small subunit [Deinococcus sp. Marseille-Q6407]|uniref:exodeoxyribonuclease VII small subunit n=1 Tax=Deinococcus sp. Marseille-Q6407 TaxID=2969223 RepID=UPI0021BF7875|nr:exodeoxyribonuclease VII small subunit [Deinococcus sp. Marseille-Q6407]
MPRAKAAADPQPSYREAYAALSRIVAELENGDTDLDRVLPLLEEARAAYQVCQSRIAAVSQAVGGADWLAETETGAESSGAEDPADTAEE